MAGPEIRAQMTQAVPDRPEPRVPRPAGNLPEAVTSFVGRRREVAATKQRMTGSRLVTLIGSGGVGKTRLALQVGGELRKTVRDGVWLVELASLAGDDAVAQAVLTTLGGRDRSTRPPEEQLIEHVRERQLLVLLDNCEHVLDGCARLVATLLRAAPGVRVLATSREPLGIQGEQVFPVPPLSTPDPRRPPPPEGLVAYEAVSLLVDRARSVRPDFRIDLHNHRAVTQLVAWLDGIPLAVELAAVRLRSLSVEEVVERLDRRFELLTSGDRAAMPRQQTLRALVDWSYDLCSAEEQTLWRRLSVFAGTFDLPAAEAVCAGPDLAPTAIVDLLDHLVAKSIVLAVRRGHRLRYRLLMTVRDYGRALLSTAGEVHELGRRHRDHYQRRARSIVEHFCGPEQATAITELREDAADFRAALEWSLSQAEEVRTGAALAADLRYLWVLGGSLGEGRRWLDAALHVVESATDERGQALWVAAWISELQGDFPAAERRVAELEALCAELRADALRAHCAQQRGITTLFGGDPAGAVVCFERALEAHRRSGHLIGELMTLFQLAVAQAYAERLSSAEETCDAALRISEARRERWTHAYALWARGIICWRRGHLGDARRAVRQALLVQREFQDGICVGLSIELLGWIAAAEGTHAPAARLLGAAAAVWHELGTDIRSFGVQLSADSLAAAERATAALGAERFATCMAECAGCSIERAVELALDPGQERPAAERAIDSPLSKREREVADLLAQGLSNKRIAETLVVSPRTVDGHVERILAKLAFSSRAQVAAWVAAHPLPGTGSAKNR